MRVEHGTGPVGRAGVNSVKLRRTTHLMRCSAMVLLGLLTACTTTGEACDSCSATTRSVAPVSQPDPRAQAEARARAALDALPGAAAARGGEGASLDEIKPFAVPKSAVAKPATLSDAVTRALSDNPQVGLAIARVDEAAALVNVAKAPLYPQAEASVAGGHGLTGNYASNIGDYWSTKNAMGAARVETNLIAKQLLFNFGATTADIDRAARTLDSQSLQSVATAEDVAYSVSQAYLNVLQQRELLKLADENLAALKDIARLVDENERNGNATLADVKRARARVLDAQTFRSDQDYQLHLATDRFRRLARAEPGALRAPKPLSRNLPATKEAALQEAYRANPAILSLQSSIVAGKRELDAVKLGTLPSLNLEAGVTGKHNAGEKNKTELDVRTVAAMRYKLLDGGLQSAQIDQAASRIVQQEMKLQSQKDDIEADLRQFYWQLESARGKQAGLSDGVETSLKARELYNEQFRGGKRTLLELLDVETAYFNARKTQITNRFDEQLATFGIIKAVGRFVRTVVGMRA
jgi:adhesin transport system outer membrane protein